MKKYISVSLLFLSVLSFGQGNDKEKANLNMKIAIKEFFVNTGEINEENKLEFEAKEILDGSDLEKNIKGIYLIRTVYRTDGIDYLLFKDGELFEIVPLDNLKIILNRTINLLSNDSDEKLLDYIPKLLKWYNDNAKSRNRGVRLQEKK
jgi:hypothetical protein